MKLPFFASFIMFILVLTRVIRKNSKQQKSLDENFWEREKRANSTRKKPLDDLNYIGFTLENITMSDKFLEGFIQKFPDTAETVADYRDTFDTLSQEKIVNLTGYTNTDLKLEYGTANLTILSRYDQNYTLFVLTLQKWADLLLQKGYQAEAASVMEFAVETSTDISRTYYLLADYYKETGEPSKIQKLLAVAETLRSANKDIIVRTLQESCP